MFQSDTASKKDEKMDSASGAEDEPEINFSHILESDVSTPCKSPVEDTVPITSQKRPHKIPHNNVSSKKVKPASNKVQLDDQDLASMCDDEPDYIEAPNLKIESVPLELEEAKERAVQSGETNANGSVGDPNSQDHGRFIIAFLCLQFACYGFV